MMTVPIELAYTRKPFQLQHSVYVALYHRFRRTVKVYCSR